MSFIPSYRTLPKFDGSYGKHVVKLPKTTNAVAAKYCLDNNYPGWVRWSGQETKKYIVYILPRGSGSEVASQYERGESQGGQQKNYDTFLLVATTTN
jgi:tartrate dehydratase alpha subunit/fumarate hydratase class I-like protein